MEKSGLVFGAGAIGKAVAGYVLNQSGVRVVFSDINQSVVEDINRRKHYRIFSAVDIPSATCVDNITAIPFDNKQELIARICATDYLFTAVGINGLSAVCQIVAAGVKARIARRNLQPAWLVLCENHADISALARQMLAEYLTAAELEHIRPVGTSVERMAKPSSGLSQAFDVIAEPFYPLLIDSSMICHSGLLFANPVLFSPVENLQAYYYRKLYTNNLGHAVLGYLGYLRHYQNLTEALADKEINRVLQKALQEAGDMLVEKFGFPPAEIGAHLEQLVAVRYANRGLNDAISRVARDPIRKLARQERLIGAASLCLACGIYPEAILTAILAALAYRNPADRQAQELGRMLDEQGFRHVLQEVCGLTDSHPLYQALQIKLEKTGGVYDDFTFRL